MDRPGARLVALVAVTASAAPAAAQRARATTTDATTVAAAAQDAAITSRAPSHSVTSSGNLDVIALQERWHDVPQSKRLRLSVQIVDEVTELGNLIGTSMNELSDDMVGLKFDGRRRRAKLRVGTGEGQYLRFKLESDWHFTQGRARIAAKLQLGIGEHHWNIELPDMEMAPANYRGDRGVEIRIPLFERAW